uniref:Methylguanine DNA methyltransferase ribonuclease-like domain-containing protein n=1 Tax=Sus scrofa TaxID=9823 RepID=A0A8D1H434_PIG
MVLPWPCPRVARNFLSPQLLGCHLMLTCPPPTAAAWPGERQVLGSMGKTCEMGRAVVDSPLGKIEISGCEQGLHEIRLCGRKTLDPDPAEAPAPPKQLAGPEEMMEPLGQCAAWLDAYFRKPAVLQELPVPALHHPLFQQGSF